MGSGRRIEPDPAGSRIADRYEVLRLLGQGGMGAVYECLDHRLHRRLAIKRMILDSDAALERFQREARAIAALSHPGIVTVWDFDRDAKGPFLVMELLEGQDLHTRVAKEGPLPAAEVQRIVASTSQALHYAHRNGIVHRDIKPSNLFLLKDGTVKIIDFGLVRGDMNPQVSMIGVGMGTADYASPEQQEDASRADARSDQYSLGMTLYFLVVGRRPRMLRPTDLPELLRDIAFKMLEDDPSERFGSMEEVSAALLASSPKEAARAATPVPMPQSVRFEARASTADMEVAQLMQLAERGDAAALFELGNRYSEGQGVPTDRPRAFKYYVDADARGFVLAKGQLSLAHLRGFGTPVNPAKALEYAQAGIEFDDPEAMATMAALYSEGEVLKQDDKQAFAWAERAVERGNRRGLVTLGDLLAAGRGRPKDEARAVQHYQAAAKLGSPLAMYRLGECYFFGRGVEEDEAESLVWYGRAFEAGAAIAGMRIGKAHEHGWGTEANAEEAFRWYQLAHDAGSLEGSEELGRAYVNGIGTHKDPAKAAPLFQLAADGGSLPALVALAQLYRDGQGVTKDLRQAKELLTQAAKAGYADGMVELAELLLEGAPGIAKNVAGGLEWMRTAAETGDADAQITYAFLLLEGRHTARDDDEAIRWLTTASESGPTLAMRALALAYFDDESPRHDPSEGIRWLEHAAEEGDVDARYDLARRLHDGDGVEEDKVLAADLYEECAQAGHVIAPAYLGFCYEHGHGRETSPAKAAMLYKQAAERGSGWGAWMYSRCLREGTGVAKNLSAARALLMQHLDSGIPACRVAYGQMLEWGEGGQADPAGAVRQYAIAAEGGDPEAAYYQGHALVNGAGVSKQLDQGIELLKQAAQAGEGKAHLLLSLMRSSYLQGQWTRIMKGGIVDGRPPSAPRVEIDAELTHMKVPAGEHAITWDTSIEASLEAAEGAYVSGAAELLAAWLTQQPRRETAARVDQTPGAPTMDIEQRALRIISDKLKVSVHKLRRETHFANDLGVDSLASVELVMSFEDEFEITIPDEEAARLTTLGEALEYLKAKLGNEGTQATETVSGATTTKPKENDPTTGCIGCLGVILLLWAMYAMWS